jgi:hypothetical protein
MVGTIVEVVLLFLRWYFKKQDNDAEAMKQFYKFVHSVNSNYIESSKAEKIWKDQAEELNKILDAPKILVAPKKQS